MLGFRKKDKKATKSVFGNKSNKPRSKKSHLLRLMTDLAELDKVFEKHLKFPDPKKIDRMMLTLYPSDGLWQGKPHTIEIVVPEAYPIKPPKCTCKTKIWHPNIDMEGHVCLNILRKDYRPVLNINTIFIGLHFLFLEPNADDPLNKEAADQFETDYNGFKRKAQRMMPK